VRAAYQGTRRLRTIERRLHVPQRVFEITSGSGVFSTERADSRDRH